MNLDFLLRLVNELMVDSVGKLFLKTARVNETVVWITKIIMKCALFSILKWIWKKVFKLKKSDEESVGEIAEDMV